MSVRVNLLPQVTRASAKATQQRVIAGLLAVVFLAALGGLYWWQSNRISDAEERLAQQQLVASGLQREVDALVEYRDLGEAQEQMISDVQATMGNEASLAAVLQDLALGFPEDAQLDALNVELTPPEIDPATGAAARGVFTVTGRSLSSHAPGVERLLLSIDQFHTLYDLHVSSSTLEELDEDLDEDVQAQLERLVTFIVDGRISEAAATGRYVDGLPEELR
jgi:Tfp pilus assembly protein PilN